MAEISKTEALSDEDLDGVVGACPVPYPDLGGENPSEGGPTIPVSDKLDTTGGSTSGTLKAPKLVPQTGPLTWSMDVKIEGKNPVRTTDILIK